MELYSLLSILTLGLILGIKHSLEADHVIAVSTVATHQTGFRKAVITGVYWGIGHTLTLFLMGMIVLVLRVSIPDDLTFFFEFLVGIMLVYLGISHLLKKDVKVHRSKGMESGKKPLIIGMIHGVAGGSALVLLSLSTVDNFWHGTFFILIFGFGTIVGMALFSSIIGISIFYSERFNHKLQKGITVTAGVISIFYGLVLMWLIGSKWIF